MRVSDILRSKSMEGLISLPPSAAVSEAAKLMSDNRIGTIVVSQDGATLAGILSERDIVRELGRRGGGCLTEALSSLMTADVKTCSPTTEVEAVLQQMTAGRFRHMPVEQEGKVIGLISIGDVVKAQINALTQEKAALTDMIMGHA